MDSWYVGLVQDEHPGCFVAVGLIPSFVVPVPLPLPFKNGLDTLLSPLKKIGDE
jgi:hypothetical protein